MPILSLDTICNSATYFAGQWSPALKLNQSRDVLRLVLSKMYPLCGGSLFHGKAQASHEALGASLGLTREWTGKLLTKLRDAKWIETYAPRRPDGKLREITIYRPGKLLKKLLIMLITSKQRTKNRVNAPAQKVPTEQERAKNKALFAELIAKVSEQRAMNPAQKR